MKSFKFFQKNLTSSEGGLIAVFAPTMRHFLNWKRETFRDRTVEYRQQNYFQCDGVGYKYIAHEVDATGCRFTNFHVISEVDGRRQRILNDVVRRVIENNEGL